MERIVSFHSRLSAIEVKRLNYSTVNDYNGLITTVHFPSGFVPEISSFPTTYTAATITTTSHIRHVEWKYTSLRQFKADLFQT